MSDSISKYEEDKAEYMELCKRFGESPVVRDGMFDRVHFRALRARAQANAFGAVDMASQSGLRTGQTVRLISDPQPMTITGVFADGVEVVYRDANGHVTTSRIPEAALTVVEVKE